MRASTSFDTLQYARKLESVGLSAEQAEVHAEAIKELIDDKLATKDDLRHLEDRLIAVINEKINDSNTQLNERINDSNAQLNERINDSNAQLNERINVSTAQLNERINVSTAQLNERINELYHFVNEKMSAMEKRFYHLEKRIDKLEKRIDELSYTLTIRLGSLMIAGIVSLSIIIKLF